MANSARRQLESGRRHAVLTRDVATGLISVAGLVAAGGCYGRPDPRGRAPI